MTLWWMTNDDLFVSFGQMPRAEKNYSVFGDVVSVDATYSTNQYDMKFVPFTGVNHHLQSVFLGAAFLANEKIESYS